MTCCLQVSLLSNLPHLSSSEFWPSVCILHFLYYFPQQVPSIYTHVTKLFIHTSEYSIQPHLPPESLSYFNSAGWTPELRAQRPRKWGLSSSTCSGSLSSKASSRYLEPTSFLSSNYQTPFRLEVKQQGSEADCLLPSSTEVRNTSNRINSIKSPTSSAGNTSEFRLMSRVARVREVVRA